MPDATPAHSSHYASRMVLAYRYGSLAFAAIAFVQVVAFAALGSWGVVALELAALACALAIYVLIRRGHYVVGLLAAQAVLIVIIVVMGLTMDVPTPEAPRISHLYLLVVAALGYLNYQREKSRLQLALIGLCLLAFIVLASAPLASVPLITMPAVARTVGTWINTILATTMLAACIHAMQAEFVRKDRFSRDLMAALWNDEFQLVFQPQVDLARATIGAEALLRWNNPQRGTVSPAAFIPQAEKLGLMVAIGSWVLEKGCDTLAKWGTSPHLAHLTLSINVSASQLIHEDFEALVRDTLIKTGANPQRLVLELTESVLVTDMELVIAKLDGLRDLGITISLDDFGTGFSSLSYLRRLPIQQIKIDRGFVQDATKSPRGASLVNNVIRIGLDLGQDVLAEGVETMEQHAFMVTAGCSEFQGYLYGRPMTRVDFERRIELEAEASAAPSVAYDRAG